MTNSALRVFSIIHMVARILTGEISVVPQAALPVANVAYNRLDIWGYDGWHAIADEPADWALDAAEEAYWQRRGGNLYALSEADIVALGFDKDGWENVGSERWPVWIGGEWE